MSVLIETSKGDIVVDLFLEERPKCCMNFLKLCKIKYYNFCLFHNVQRNFLVQTGDPASMGHGGQSVWGALKGEEYRTFEAELVPRLNHVKVGTVSMADNGSGCHGSQFFITTGENLEYLNGKHTVFGEVAEGMDVLTAINEAYCDKDGRPYQDIRIYHTVILEDPFDDPEGLVVPERSPSPPPEVLKSDRIGAAEDIDEFKGKSEEEVREIVATRESRANAQILEMVGDIPDVDARPPENVLFVCKLNPVTTDEDLEIIFSRFGPIVSCEVIRDQKTGDSLQYAFIEFENEEDCVKAYFKMDNVLVDDRRIHVDFSQSLAKVKGISRRKLSEEVKVGGVASGDGLVDRRKRKESGGDGYDMVFGDDGGPVKKLEVQQVSKQKEQMGGAGDRRMEEKRDQRREERREQGREERRDQGREERRDQGREERREHQGREKGQGHYGHRHKGPNRGGDREEQERTGRHREEGGKRGRGHGGTSDDSRCHGDRDGDKAHGRSERHGSNSSGKERQKRSRSRSRSREKRSRSRSRERR